MNLFRREPTHPFNSHVIYISGPHGSGKSTLVHDLNESSEDLVVQDRMNTWLVAAAIVAMAGIAALFLAGVKFLGLGGG
jgi:hypothetical protein